MRLSLDTREVGHVTIVRCNGRITAGEECEALRSHVTWLLRDRRAIVLHMGDVGFIDSCGIGTIVRSLTSTRQAHGDLKLCNISENVRKILEMSRLATVFDTHESEEKAVAAFYGPRVKVVSPARLGHSILCVERNADVLSYLRAMLHRAGYNVQSTNHIGDALMLLRVTRFDLVLLGPDSATGTHQPFQSACASLPVVELSHDFSTLEAGEAAAGVLQQIESRLNPMSA